MGTTVAAALKKIAVAILTDKKARKVVGGIILGVIIIILMPIAAILGIFNGSVKIDTNKLQQEFSANMTAEEQAQLQTVQTTMTDIETQMTANGHSDRIQEAQVLYVFVLSNHAADPDFVTRLVSCFASGQTNEQIVAAVNAAFGTSLSAADFANAMACVKGISIDTSGWTNTGTKNNLDLVLWAKAAAESKWGYVYGTYGTVLDESLLRSKITQFPEEVGGNEEFIRQNWLGRRTADCVGLIKGYGWYDPVKNETVIGSNGMPDIGADTMFNNAAEKGTIDSIPEIPGLAVWHEGHIGIYIGNGQVVQAANTHAGVILTPIGVSGWTHWLKIPYITYTTKEATSK